MKAFFSVYLFASLLAGLCFLSAVPAVSKQTDTPLQAELGNIQIQYMTRTCGVKNLIIMANLQYFGADKTVRIEGFIPKIHSQIFLYISDYATEHAGKELQNRDILRIMEKTAEQILGKNYISEVLLFNIVQI